MIKNRSGAKILLDRFFMKYYLKIAAEEIFNGSLGFQRLKIVKLLASSPFQRERGLYFVSIIGVVKISPL